MSGDTHNHISGGTFFSTVIQGRDLTVQLPPQVTPALSGLPAGSPAFTGRIDDLQTVLDGLAPHATATGETAAGSAVVVTAVGGMGGVGKTELAVQAARAALARGWFPGGVLFADMFGYDPARRVEVGQALEGFLRALGIPPPPAPPWPRISPWRCGTSCSCGGTPTTGSPCPPSPSRPPDTSATGTARAGR
ncbi:hypothetical protein [Nonomuraea sp. NPDC046570]|uniref:hypothetical protein n=1 Tax=Nonomuraea sp. NPDC046570 TaxID=3155255 RepID=UPI003409F3EC